MKRDVTLFLEDIIENIELIEKSAKSKNKLLKDKDIRDATVRRLEVIGEAAKNIPEDFFVFCLISPLSPLTVILHDKFFIFQPRF